MTSFQSSSFNARADELLARIEYRRATSDAERDAIFRMRYEGYTREGGIEPNTSHRFTDPWDDTPNADLIGVYLEGRLAASVRIHVSSVEDDIPATEPYPDVMVPYLDQGLRLVDATRFVVDHSYATFVSQMPFLTLRAVAMAAEHYRAFGLVAAVRREHTVVYTRVTGHRALTGARAYPLLRRPLVCMFVETANLEKHPYVKHPFLRSTHEERERVFGSPAAHLRPRRGDAAALAAGH